MLLHFLAGSYAHTCSPLHSTGHPHTVLHSLSWFYTFPAHPCTLLHSIAYPHILLHSLTHPHILLHSLTNLHLYIVSGLTTLRPYTCCQKFTVSMITPPTRPCTWSHISSFQGNPHTQTLHTVSLVHSLQGKPFPDPTPGVPCPQSPWWPRHLPCTWGHGYPPSRPCT